MSINENKNFIIPGAILIGFILLLAGTIWAINAFSFRVGTIDVNKIIKDSSVGQQINKELQAKGNELNAKLQSAKSDAEKSAINNEFQKFQNDKNNAFSEKVKQVVAKVAKQKGIKAVTSPQVFIYTDMDLTSAVITELDK